MMTISDERRKTAELMRNEASEFRRLGKEYDHVWTVDLGDVPAIFQDIAHYVGLDGTVRTDELFDRVADLIDPTCHEVGSWCESGLYYPTIYHHELSCGHTITTPYGALPECCDECGARILDYGERED
jgi:hypothetical protein